MADDGWKAEVAKHVLILSNMEMLEAIGLTRGEPNPDLAQQDRVSDKVFQLCFNLGGKRGWSLSKHSLPPDCYAGLLTNSAARRQRSADLMRADAQKLFVLEQRVANGDGDSKALRSDLICLEPAPIRMLLALFEQDRF